MINILLPVDFSDKQHVLLDAAIRFAGEVQGKIHLLHVAPSDLGFAISDTGFQYFPDVEHSEILNELKQLNALHQEIESRGVPCVHLLKQGVAKDIILEYAKEIGASYIVLGSHGRSGIYDIFVGSLTKDITKLSDIPVLVIPCH